MVTEYKTDLSKIYSEISESIQQLNSFPLKDITTQPYRASIISGLVKCYQFNLEINNKGSDEYSFYLTSFLRGMCEDLISLKFLMKFDVQKREEITYEYMRYLLMSSIQTQGRYFKSQRPFQPTVEIKNIDTVVATHSENLDRLWQSLGHRKGKTFPSVEQMAIDSGLKSLYDFLYHATSRAVHFSPNVLLRTGWYRYTDKEPIIEFSVNNFSEYYSLFNSHYATTLFIEFVKSFKKFLPLDKPVLNACKRLVDRQNELYFFPEIITYEELNINRPSNVDYKILEMTSKMDDQERTEFMKALPDILKELKKRSDKK